MSAKEPRLHRSLELALFGASITWAAAANLIAARAARGIAVRVRWSDGYLLLDAVFVLFLLAMGFALLQGVVERGAPLRRTLGLPKRPTAGAEWATGAAIGWGVVAAAVLPMALGGALSIRFWVEGRAWWLAGLNLVTVAVLALGSEMAFRGYPYRRLIGAVGPGWATVAMSLVSGAAVTYGQDATYLSTLIAVLLGAVLCTAWLRTHGLWLGWGLRFAWIASMGVVFGLPVTGVENLSTVVETRAIGVRWLTGGELGVEGALLTLVLLVAAIAVVVKVSGDWAWDYTRPELVPAGYPMDVAPPAAHVEMEKAATATSVGAGLVQILPTTPQGRSVEREG
jgi:membrane protease YdiL (CAAX protease family)